MKRALAFVQVNGTEARGIESVDEAVEVTRGLCVEEALLACLTSCCHRVDFGSILSVYWLANGARTLLSGCH